MVRDNEELARRLGCAATSVMMGISYAHCYKTYFKDKEPGKYWYELANRVIKDYVSGNSENIISINK